MSQTEKLLSNIHEYSNLLGFLKDRYPTVLDEWKNKAVAPQGQQQAHSHSTTAAVTIPRTSQNGNYRNK